MIIVSSGLVVLILVQLIFFSIERMKLISHYSKEISQLNELHTNERSKLLDRIQANSFIEYKQMEIATKKEPIKQEEGPKYEYMEV